MLDINILENLLKETYIKSKRNLSIKSNLPYTTLLHMTYENDMLVGSLVEIAKVLSVPMDKLIKKNYSIVTYNLDGTSKMHNTTNIIEATFYNFLEDFCKLNI